MLCKSWHCLSLGNSEDALMFFAPCPLSYGIGPSSTMQNAKLELEKITFDIKTWPYFLHQNAEVKALVEHFPWRTMAQKSKPLVLRPKWRWTWKTAMCNDEKKAQVNLGEFLKASNDEIGTGIFSVWVKLTRWFQQLPGLTPSVAASEHLLPDAWGCKWKRGTGWSVRTKETDAKPANIDIKKTWFWSWEVWQFFLVSFAAFKAVPCGARPNGWPQAKSSFSKPSQAGLICCLLGAWNIAVSSSQWTPETGPFKCDQFFPPSL